MIGVAEGGREATDINIFKLNIIPPGKRVGPEQFNKAEDGEKGGYSYDEVDEVAVLGSGSDRVDNEVENG